MAEEQKQLQLTEKQLIQMAQQEEAEFNAKNAVSENLGRMLLETIKAKEVLEELKKTDGKIMVSVGATVLIEAEIKKATKCKRGVAEGTYKEENIDETIKWLFEKEEKIKEQFAAVQKQAAESNDRLTNIVGILKQIENEKTRQATRKMQNPPTLSK